MAALVVSESAEPGSRDSRGRGGCSNTATSRPRFSGWGLQVRDRTCPGRFLPVPEVSAVTLFGGLSPELKGPTLLS